MYSSALTIMGSSQSSSVPQKEMARVSKKSLSGAATEVRAEEIKEIPSTRGSTATAESIKSEFVDKTEIISSSECSLKQNTELLGDPNALEPYSAQNEAKSTTSDGTFRIFINTGVGKTVSLDVNEEESITSLKQKVMQREGVPVEKQRLKFDNEQLVEGKTVSDYNLEKGSMLFLFTSLRGGVDVSTFGFDFNNLTNLEKRQFGPGPSYRSVAHGLNFQTICKNEGCTAYYKTVFVKKGFATFDIPFEADHLDCPACKKRAEISTNCGFYMAKWEFEGRLASGEHKIMPGRADTEEYYTYRNGDNGMWKYLRVTVTPLQ